MSTTSRWWTSRAGVPVEVEEVGATVVVVVVVTWVPPLPGTVVVVAAAVVVVVVAAPSAVAGSAKVSEPISAMAHATKVADRSGARILILWG